MCQASGKDPVVRIPENSSQQVFTAQVSDIREGLFFRYPYSLATQTPSKQTATDRKGRIKDQEAAEYTSKPPEIFRKWRRPSFIRQQITGKEYGNIMHTVMQYISYAACVEEAGIRNEISRLVRKGFLTPEQGEAVDAGKLMRFFTSELGKKLCSGIPCLREFKFSILDSGTRNDPSLEGEQILLQGVVDCALLEEDGITIIDFKTDYVTEENLSQIALRYCHQIQAYAEALERIYEQPVKARYLYLFHLDRFIAI